MCASEKIKKNLQGNPVVYWDKASGPRVETQGLANLYPAVHPFYPYLNTPCRTHTECVYCNVAKMSLHCASYNIRYEKENKDFDFIWFYSIIGKVASPEDGREVGLAVFLLLKYFWFSPVISSTRQTCFSWSTCGERRQATRTNKVGCRVADFPFPRDLWKNASGRSTGN